MEVLPGYRLTSGSGAWLRDHDANSNLFPGATPAGSSLGDATGGMTASEGVTVATPSTTGSVPDFHIREVSEAYPAICEYLSQICPEGFISYMGTCTRGIEKGSLAEAEVACKDATLGIGKIVDGPGNPVLRNFVHSKIKKSYHA